MNCISPITIKNPKGERVTVPCSKCVFCLKNRQQDWIFRISEEVKVCDSAYFVTLTYDDDNIKVNDNGEEELCKSDLQKYFKRLRKNIGNTEKPIRYYAVGEYGSKTDRPHYHIILFNVPVHSVDFIDKCWHSGFVHIGNVEGASINYTTKYLINEDDRDYTDRVKPFQLCPQNRRWDIAI